MKVYCPSNNHKLEKILFTAKIYNQALQHVQVPFNYSHKQFNEVYPHVAMPALQLTNNDGYAFGTNTVLTALVPAAVKPNNFQQAEINQWFQLIEKDFESSVGVLILNQIQLSEVTVDQIVKAKDSISKILKTADDRLKLRTFLVGDRLSIADISLYFSWKCVRSQLEKQIKNYVHLSRWAAHIGSLE